MVIRPCVESLVKYLVCNIIAKTNSVKPIITINSFGKPNTLNDSTICGWSNIFSNPAKINNVEMTINKVL